MNQEQTQNVFIGLLAAGLILLGGGVYLISQQVKSVATSVRGIQQGVAQLKEVKPVVASDFTTIGRLSFKAGGDDFWTIEHRCRGDRKTAGDLVGDKSYCIGKNQLVLVSPAGAEKVLNESTVQAVFDYSNFPPVLSSIDYIVNSEGTSQYEKLAIEYGSDECILYGNCGDFFGFEHRVRHVQFVLNTRSMEVMKADFPPNEVMVWNFSETKAIVFPNTCGGVGCQVEVLSGYDLISNQLKVITTEKAAQKLPGEDPYVLGEGSMPYWDVSSVKWITESKATIDIVKPNKSRQTVTVNF